jgi:hypothetical protein
MLTSLFLAALMQSATVAQVQPAPASALPVEALNNGPCLDSSHAVPRVLQAPVVRATQIVRIDKVTSTATMTTGEVIGFLYTLQDGTTWLGQRAAQYMSPAEAAQINTVLASTHMPDSTVTAFPPQTRLGVKTNYLEYFRVQIPAAAMDPLRIRLDPCVAWPAGRPLPDPAV